MATRSSSNPWALPGGLSGVCVSTLLGGSLFIANASKPQRVSPPTSWASFTAPDKSFRCEVPGGWKQETVGNGSETSGVIVRQGGARVRVLADTKGSLMADISKPIGGMTDMGAGGGEGIPSTGGGGMPDLSSVPGAGAAGLETRKSPVEALHEKGKEDYEDSLAESGYSGYEEQQAQQVSSGLGEGRVSEFTFKKEGLMGGGKFHGYRATFLSTDKRVSVAARCGEDDWTGMKPAFMKMIQGLGPGQ
jgi:hypothetical protein